MKANGICIPAISREIEFLARHTDEAAEVTGDNIEADAGVRALLNAVSDRAERDVFRLLNKVKAALIRACKIIYG